MNNTTNTSAHTEQLGKQVEIPSLAEIDMRDYFAAKAMQAHITSNWILLVKSCENKSDAIGPLIAKIAYEMSDSMIEARK